MICMKEVRHHIVQRDPTKQADAAAAAAAAATAAGACDDTASEAAAEAVVAVPLLNRVPIPEDLDLEPLAMVRKGHFDLAVKRVQPSSMREGFSTVCGVGGLSCLFPPPPVSTQHAIIHVPLPPIPDP